MKKSEYSEQYKDPQWQEFRLRVFERDGFKCSRCGDSKSTLHAHHLYYISGRSPWNYPKGCVITLCDQCHEQEHADFTDNISKWEVAVASTALTDELVELLAWIKSESTLRGMEVKDVMSVLSLSIQYGKISAKECLKFVNEQMKWESEQKNKIGGSN